jgi:uncharacterized protein YjbJ (UPF0337 family)
MNWDRIAGQWRQLKGQAQMRWGRITDDDWTLIEGSRDALIGKLQSLYGRSKDEIEREVDEWSRTTW